jgi:3-hydroxybutyryl-CoA dehydrogenase
MAINKVGVAGCGLMGSGIVEVCARSGRQVVVSEINEDFLNKGLGMLRASLAKGVERGKITKQEEEATLSRVKGTVDIKDFADCDLIIEVIIEIMDEKKKLFSSLDQLCPEHTIFASNTSSLSIIEMASATKRAGKVLGMHFFNPVPTMRLVELVRSIATSDETLNIAIEFSKSLGKEVVIAKDSPGFIVNLLLVPYVNDAIRALESGLATKEDIDTAIKLGLNHPMGPLTLADFVGLDTLYYIGCAMYDEFKDPKYTPPPLLKKMVLANWLGRKTGKGFYEYK